MSEFELGTTVVLMGYDPRRSHREPKLEAVITARGEDCVRVRYRGVFGRRVEKWFSLISWNYHLTPTKLL
jgi:hypothetical protein